MKRVSREYIEFLLAEQRRRKPRTWYEKLCKFSEKLGISPPRQVEEKIKFYIAFSNLNVSPKGVFSATILFLILSTFITALALLLLRDLATLMLLLAAPFFFTWYIYTYPSFRASVMRVQAGDESIKIILYMTIYLKLNPNFEGAVNFALQHVQGPISEDMRKAMWDLHVGKYKTVEEALGVYTQKWVWWNEDFVRALSLLYGVLTEPTERGREEILRKALNFILNSSHAKMKKYVEEIYSPIMVLHAMGLLLPAIGLIMFPMIAIFLHQEINVTQLIVGYLIFLPIINLFLINRILQKRPGAFMVPDISKHPELPPEDYFELKIGGKKMLIPIKIFSVLVGFLVMSYGILHFTNLAIDLYSRPPGEPRKEILLREAVINVENVLASFSITAGFGMMAFLYFYLRSFQRMKIRNAIKNIEEEFKIGLFSLGNYLAEGYPIEVGMKKTLEEYEKLGMEKRPTYAFFQRLFYNIKNFGMSFKKALFDRKYGVIKYFPSVLLREIMTVLADASEKSTVLLGNIAKTIASYLENVFVIEAKIRELLEETRAALRLQASFVIPMITATVGALGSFILNMLRLLALKLAEIEKSLGIVAVTGGGLSRSASSVVDLIVKGFANVIPMTVFRTVVGVYTVEAVILFSVLLSGIEEGFDKTARDWNISQNLLKAIVVYGVVNIIALIIFHGLQASLE